MAVCLEAWIQEVMEWCGQRSGEVVVPLVLQTHLQRPGGYLGIRQVGLCFQVPRVLPGHLRCCTECTLELVQQIAWSIPLV
jgi:hypothetical protein